LAKIQAAERITNPEKVSRPNPGTSAKIEALQRESEVLLTDLKLVEESYATQALDLTIGLGYVERLLANTRIEKYLTKHHVELLNEFNKLIGEKAEEMSRTISPPIRVPPKSVKSTAKPASEAVA